MVLEEGLGFNGLTIKILITVGGKLLTFLHTRVRHNMECCYYAHTSHTVQGKKVRSSRL